MRITLDKSVNTTESPFSIESIEPSPEEIRDTLEQDQSFQKDLQKINDAENINWDIVQELYAILSESEGDLYDVSENDRYINWETKDIGYNVLRSAGNVEAARLIKNKRRLDFAQYARIPGKNEVQKGAKLVFSDTDYSPTPEEKAMLRQWERRLFDKIFFAGNDPTPSFTKFLGNAYEDFFDLDDITISVRKDKFGEPLALHLTDPILIKPIIRERKYPSYNDQEELYMQEYLKNFEPYYHNMLAADEEQEKDYLLIYNGKRIAALTREDVRKHHFFTRTAFRKAQRGFSIVEQGISILTWIQNSLKYNATNFTNNRLPKGFVHFSGGGVGQIQLERLKKVMYAHINGAGGAHRVPMMASKGDKGDAKWVGIGGNSKDMEFHLWATLLFSIYCQLSGTDPRELSLGAHTDAVGKKSLFEESSDGIIKESRDAGARTFLMHIEDAINHPDKYGKNIFQRITKLDVRLKFLGLEIEDKKAKLETTKLKLETDTSLNELIVADDKEKETLMIGDINIFDVPAINNPSVYQAVQFLAQQKQQEEMAQQQMMPGPEGEMMPGPEGAPPAEDEELTEADRALLEQYGDQAEIEEGIE